MIVAERETAGDVFGESAQALAHRLPDRLERLEAIRPPAGVDADALGRALGRLSLPSWRNGPSALPMMIDRNEHRGLAFAGHHRAGRCPT